MEEIIQFLHRFACAVLHLHVYLFVNLYSLIIFSAAFGLDGDVIPVLAVIIECVFGIEILLSTIYNLIYCFLDFLTEYWGDDFFYPVRDIKKIAIRYLKYVTF